MGAEQAQKEKAKRIEKLLGHVECKNGGIHTGRRDVGVGMARSMIGLSDGVSLFLGHNASDKFYQPLAHYASWRAVIRDVAFASTAELCSVKSSWTMG